MGLVNFTEATLLMKTQSQQISQWVCGEASTAEHASHTHLFNQYFLAQKASEMKGENFRVVMLSLTRKPLHRGIIKQRGTQAACDCVLNSERFVIPREGQKLPFHVTVGQRAREDPSSPVSPLCQGARLWGSLSDPVGFIFSMLCSCPLLWLASSCCRTFDTRRLC